MKKINFSDKFGLTEAVLSSRKTQTRRLIKLSDVEDYTADIAYAGKTWEAIEKSIIARHSKYKVGEIVAVAQSYKNLGYSKYAINRAPKTMEIRGHMEESAGWNNKMFVRAEACKNRIRITNVRVERLRDITEADCLAEGIENVKECEDLYRIPIFHKSGRITYIHGSSPRAVYAALIDRISGKGTWERNPWVFVYDFELVK